MKQLWQRALANRAYWIRYQLAQDGLQARAKLVDQDPKDKRRAVLELELRPARMPLPMPEPLVALPASDCPLCGGPRELRAGNPRPTHLAGRICSYKEWRDPILPPGGITIQRCSGIVLFRGKDRFCKRPAVSAGLCARCASLRRRAATLRADGSPQEEAGQVLEEEKAGE
jgi:hypothetical protein